MLQAGKINAATADDSRPSRLSRRPSNKGTALLVPLRTLGKGKGIVRRRVNEASEAV